MIIAEFTPGDIENVGYELRRYLDLPENVSDFFKKELANYLDELNTINPWKIDMGADGTKYCAYIMISDVHGGKKAILVGNTIRIDVTPIRNPFPPQKKQ